MSQRTKKVASLVQQVVAESLREVVPAPELSVRGVDVSPDLRQSTVWVGIVGDEARQKQLLKELESAKGDIQAAVARRMTTKFVPRIHFKLDTGGEYAEHITRLMNGL